MASVTSDRRADYIREKTKYELDPIIYPQSYQNELPAS